MSKDPTPTQSPTPKGKRSPFKTRYESLGYFFGQPLESFENLLPVQPSTSAIAPKPTDLDVIRHWMYQEDQSRTTRSHNNVNNIGIVTNNLVEFYIKYHPSVELR